MTGHEHMHTDGAWYATVIYDITTIPLTTLNFAPMTLCAINNFCVLADVGGG